MSYHIIQFSTERGQQWRSIPSFHSSSDHSKLFWSGLAWIEPKSEYNIIISAPSHYQMKWNMTVVTKEEESLGKINKLNEILEMK
jgi:hypothetical protein